MKEKGGEELGVCALLDSVAVLVQVSLHEEGSGAPHFLHDLDLCVEPGRLDALGVGAGEGVLVVKLVVHRLVLESEATDSSVGGPLVAVYDGAN